MPALEITPHTYALIVTRGHGHDQEALYHLAPTAAPYVGLIGSRRKIRLIFESLREAGVPDDGPGAGRRRRSGFDIGSQTVPEIAVSIVAELIARRNLGPDGARRAKPRSRRRRRAGAGGRAGAGMIAAVVPAAGHSQRMGRPKLILPVGGRTVIARVVAGPARGRARRPSWSSSPPADAAGAAVLRREAEAAGAELVVPGDAPGRHAGLGRARPGPPRTREAGPDDRPARPGRQPRA